MTTVFDKEERCFVCGSTNSYAAIASTNRAGSPDLDTRPPEKMRSTLSFWIRRCARCGYCAPDTSRGPLKPEAIRGIVDSDVYRRQENDASFPALANRFLCWSMVQEASGNYPEAGWTALHAAWTCDDAEAVDAARDCRRRAIALLRIAQATGMEFSQNPSNEAAILADLLRRSSLFDEVLEACKEGLAANPSQVVRKVLLFQIELAGRQDSRRYTVTDAVISVTQQ